MAVAQQLVQAGKYKQAGAAFEEVLKLSPGQREAELGLADSLQKSGRYQASLEHYGGAGQALPAGQCWHGSPAEPARWNTSPTA